MLAKVFSVIAFFASCFGIFFLLTWLPHLVIAPPIGNASATIGRTLEQLRRDDPGAAKDLEQLMESYHKNPLPLAVALRKGVSDESTATRVRRMAKKDDTYLAILDAFGARLPSELRSGGQAIGSFEFLFQLLQKIEPNTARQLEAELIKGMNDPDPSWAIELENDPVLLIARLWLTVPDELTFYRKESEWLSVTCFEILDTMEFMNSSTEGESSAANVTVSPQEIFQLIVKTAAKYPSFKTAIHKYSTARNLIEDPATLSDGDDQDSINCSILFQLYANYGQIIDELYKQGVDLEETLQVVFASQVYLDLVSEDRKSSQILLNARRNYPAVWMRAKEDPFIWYLFEVLPQETQQLCAAAKLDEVDFSTLLMSLSNLRDDRQDLDKQFLANAIRCTLKYETFAIAVMSKYRTSERFRELIMDGRLGVRVIPYTARFGDEGIEQLATNSKWLDKYFAADGTPIDPEWWTYLPGGSLAKVAKNWTQGLPSTGAELGWAAWDVADVALTVATFGGSQVATGSGKAAATGSKVAATAASRAASKGMVSAIVKGIASGTKIASKRVALLAAQRTIVGTIVRTTLRVGSQVIRYAFRIVKGGYYFAASAIKMTQKELTRISRVLSPSQKRILMRSLLAVSIVARVVLKTSPLLTEAMKRIEDTVVKSIEGINKIWNDFPSVVKELLASMNPMRWQYPPVWWWVWMLLLGVIACVTYPFNRRRYHYV